MMLTAEIKARCSYCNIKFVKNVTFSADNYGVIFDCPECKKPNIKTVKEIIKEK